MTKRMKAAALIFALASAITACRAQLVSPPGGAGSSPFAPVNEPSRPGLIKYPNGGSDAAKEKRREDAYRLMREACNGKYKIDVEGPMLEDGAVISVPSSSGVFTNSEYWYIQFSCVKE